MVVELIAGLAFCGPLPPTYPLVVFPGHHGAPSPVTILKPLVPGKPGNRTPSPLVVATRPLKTPGC